MKDNLPTRVAFSLLVTLLMCGTSCDASSLYDGTRELVGHYANMLQGQKARPPTKVRLAIVGLPRTGTGSLVEALKLLGYTTLHSDEYFELSDVFAELNDENNPLPMGAFADKVGERGFDAVYRWDPDFVKWAAADEDVKIILTVRDTPKKWAYSFRSVGKGWVDFLFSRPFVWWKPIAQVAPVIQKLMDYVPEDDIVPLEQTYVDHINRVQDAVADSGAGDDKLLIFNAKQGWAPLCQFLDLQRCPPVPEQPFPHANERYLLQLENYVMWLITWIWPLFPVMCLNLIWKAACMIPQLVKKKTQSLAMAAKKRS